MNKRVLISAVSVLSLAMVIGIAAVGGSKAAEMNIVKADPVGVEHSLVFDHDSYVNIDEYDAITLRENTEYGYPIECDSDYSCIFTDGYVQTKGDNYIIETNNIYDGETSKIGFSLYFYFCLDIPVADDITAVMYVSEKFNNDGYYWSDPTPVEPNSFETADEIAEIGFYYGNQKNALALRLVSIEFTYSCSY